MDVYADVILQNRKGVNMKKKILAVLVMVSMLFNSLSMPLYAEVISDEEAVVEEEIMNEENALASDECDKYGNSEILQIKGI